MTEVECLTKSGPHLAPGLRRILSVGLLMLGPLPRVRVLGAAARWVRLDSQRHEVATGGRKPDEMRRSVTLTVATWPLVAVPPSLPACERVNMCAAPSLRARHVRLEPPRSARQLVPLLPPLLTLMDVGRVMACAHDGFLAIKAIDPRDPLLFKNAHLIYRITRHWSPSVERLL